MAPLKEKSYALFKSYFFTLPKDGKAIGAINGREYFKINIKILMKSTNQAVFVV